MRHATPRLLASTLVLATSAVALTGCGKVNQGNYDKVQTGMTQAQVEEILGPGKEQSSTATPGMSAGGMSLPGMSAKTLVWQDGSKTITVAVVDGKVMTKAQSGL